MSTDLPNPVAHLLSGRGYLFSQLNPPSKYQVEKCGLSGEGLFTKSQLREYAGARVGELREQVDELTHEKGQLRAYVDNLRANIRRLDGLIEEVGGCTFSCINTYDDLKNSLIGLKRQRDKLQSQLDAIDNIRPIAAQHDTVMAQMAEALRLYDAEFDRLYSESRGKGLYNCDGQRLDNKLTNVAEKSGVDALAAYDKLGESA